jgi:hypothetical protein
MRRLLLILAVLCVVTWTAAFLLLRSHLERENLVIPTLMILPSLTATEIPTQTSTTTQTHSFTPTVTEAPSDTPTPTTVPTLSQRVLEIFVRMPGVDLHDTNYAIPAGVGLQPTLPYPSEPMPDATNSLPPYLGWFSFESDFPLVIYEPPWTPQLSQFASRGQFHHTEAANGSASFLFEGEGVRLQYVAASNMGIFEIVIDGNVTDTIDAYAPELAFRRTNVYLLHRGTHRLEILPTGRKNEQSAGYGIGLDAIHVFHDEIQLPPQVVASQSPSPEPQPASHIELIAAPPTLQHTATAVPPRLVIASVIIAYDENNNGTVDPAEGVSGISLRVVEMNTNRVIASSVTDERGYAEFEMTTDTPTRIAVPYFDQSWEIARGSSTSSPVFTLLLEPGNQPGLIP